MIRKDDGYVMVHGMPLMRRSTSYTCDECEVPCRPDSSDPTDWLFTFKGQQLCFECFLSETGAGIVADRE